MFYNQLYNIPIQNNQNNQNNQNKLPESCYSKSNNKTLRIEINKNLYTIPSNDISQYSEITYVALIPTIIMLPIINEYNEDVNINIINNSSGIVTIKTQNNELLFNSSYLPSSGATKINLLSNRFCKFIINKKKELFSFILLLS